ncbi:MAG: LLM class flavin-dependent oxidoreductase, partial [Salinirussus sp.]
MQIGTIRIPRESESFVEDVIAAEDAGFDLVGVADSQCLMQELYVSLGTVARETDAVELATSVTNPVTRHPVVTASALCTLDEHSNGRAVLGLSGGDSAVYTLGKSAASLREIREFCELFHALCGGEEREFEGYEVDLTWLRMRGTTREIPILLAAEGPKTLEMAGHVADRVLIGGGTTDPVVREAIERINEGARMANRDPDEIDKWVFARGAVVDDRSAVEEKLKSTVAAGGHHTFQFTFEGKRVPPELEEEISTLVAEYDSEQHLGLGDDPANRRLLDDLGLTDYFIDRFAIAGSADEVIDELHRLQAI